jgi:hypothetical protein
VAVVGTRGRGQQAWRVWPGLLCRC